MREPRLLEDATRSRVVRFDDCDDAVYTERTEGEPDGRACRLGGKAAPPNVGVQVIAELHLRAPHLERPQAAVAQETPRGRLLQRP